MSGHFFTILKLCIHIFLLQICSGKTCVTAYSTYEVCLCFSVGVFAIVSLMVGDVVRRIIDADPSLCAPDPMGNDTVNGTATKVEFDYPDCSASVDIATTMAFLSALFMVSA